MMQQQKITFIVNGQVYKVDINDRRTLQKIAKVDRLQLIHALETLKNVDEAEPQVAVEPVKTPVQPAMKSPTPPQPHRTGKGDVDSLMQQLIMEQKPQHTNIPDKTAVYKWFLIFFVVLVILIWIF